MFLLLNNLFINVPYFIVMFKCRKLADCPNFQPEAQALLDMYLKKIFQIHQHHLLIKKSSINQLNGNV